VAPSPPPTATSTPPSPGDALGQLVAGLGADGGSGIVTSASLGSASPSVIMPVGLTLSS